MKPELHAFFLDRSASGHLMHAELADAYRRACEQAGAQHELIAYTDEFEFLLDEVQDLLRDENEYPEYTSQLADFRTALTAIDARRAQVADLYIEVRQSLEEIEALRASYGEGLRTADDPYYESWLDARERTLAEVERLRADPDMAPHLDRVLTNLPELANAATPATLAEAASAAAPTPAPADVGAEPATPSADTAVQQQTDPAEITLDTHAFQLNWAGIGSRGNHREPMPPSVLADMTELARRMAADGWHLSSGGADGSDTAFASGTPVDQRTIWLPWPGYNDLSGPDCHPIPQDRLRQSLELAERFHPTWDRCTQGARKLHARNGLILLGPNLDKPVDAVVAYTQGGKLQGGTAQGLRIAMEHGIPIFNLGSMTMEEAWKGLQELRRSLTAGQGVSAGKDRTEPDAHRAATDASNLQEADRKEGMARVLHLRNAPPDAIRIDRRTRWGNPFRIGPDGTREDVISKYRDHLWNNIRAGEISKDDLAELHGKNLACHCAPQPCHGDVLASAAAWANANRNRAASPTTTQADAADPAEALLASPRITTRREFLETAENAWAAAHENPAAVAGTWQRIKMDYASLYTASGDRIHHLPHQEGFTEFRDLVAGAVQDGACPPEHRDRLKALHETLETQGRRHDAVHDAHTRLNDIGARLDDLKEKMSSEPGQTIETMPGYTGWLRDRDAAVAHWRELAADPAHKEHMQIVAPDMMAPQIAELSNAPLTSIHRASAEYPVPSSGQGVYTPSLQPLSQVYDRTLAFVDRNPALLPYAPQFDELKTAVSKAIDECRHAPDLLDRLTNMRTALDDSHERMTRAQAAIRDIADASQALCTMKSWSDRSGMPLHEAPNFNAWRDNADRALRQYEAAEHDPGLALHLARADSLGVLAETAVPMLRDPRFQTPVASEASLAASRRRSEEAEEQYSMSA